MSCSEPAGPDRQIPAVLVCFGLSFAFLLITHLSFLRLPYHWDELGYFVPAAHDVLVSGALVPHSTLPNVHPPLLMLYLALAWRLFGFAVPVTRAAMLAVGAATLTAAFVLARRLSGAHAAWMAVTLLAVSPPFVAQSMLAHLDLPATFWVLLTLCWFFDQRRWPGAAAATALALTKETGVIVPLVLALFARPRKKWALPLLLPLVALACWLVLVRSLTGHWLGNAGFERYNLTAALRLWRVPLVLLRRLYQLGFANFHWIASGLLIWTVRRGALRAREWRIVGAVAAAYLALHSALGGAILLRYLLPAMALLYIATAAALEWLEPRLRYAALAALLAGLSLCNWWNPPYPFGYEDNLAVTDFIRLQQQAAWWLSENAAGRTITTAWPLTDALANPMAGYVPRPLPVAPLENFQPASWDAVHPEQLQVVALYSRSWEPARGWQNWPPAARLLEKYFGYVPQLSPESVMARFHLRRAARWERRGQWMEILVR
ncbi:MAG TPA: glycosyltransferase family 39 protein [Bryobacterales bacterium]|nr:glycosyltransferase family 39 protein [Bryobacterales bacterium]